MVELDERPEEASVKPAKGRKKGLKKTKEVKDGGVIKKKKKGVTFDAGLSDAISELRKEAEDENEVQDEVDMQSDDEEIDEKAHSKMLKTFGVEEKKKRLKERVLPAEPQEYALQGKVAVGDLLASLSKQDGMKSAEHLADVAAEKVKTLEEPLPRFQREQVDRAINYDKTKKEVSKWLPIVKRNRESEQMVFPLYHAREAKIKEDVSAFVNKIPTNPSGPLEEEIYEVLAANQPDRALLTEEEERTLEELTAEEAEVRREELSKMRALLSYQEEKFRRKNKIKSKKYHKLLKKERQKKEEKLMSDAVKENPDAASSELEKADYLRALERISQKHKGGGKWNKNILHKNIKDPELKKALAEQKQLTKQLMEKTNEVEESEGEEEMAVEEGEKEAAVFEVDPSNPWLVVGSALSNMSTLPAVGSALSNLSTLPAVEPAAPVPAAPLAAAAPLVAATPAAPLPLDVPVKKAPTVLEPAVESDKEVEDAVEDEAKIDQDTLVEMAFANDDVVAQFVEEKGQIVDEQTEKDVDITLPGWGSWAGVGTKDKKKKFIQKAKAQAPRKDSGLTHVIINNKKNRKLSKHQVSRLPHPYKSRSNFEREMRQPIGAQWNSVKSFRNMIKPSVTVLDGHVIEPMVAPKGFDNVKIKNRRRL